MGFVLVVLTDTKIRYHSGKMQILYLRTRYRSKLGVFYSSSHTKLKHAVHGAMRPSANLTRQAGNVAQLWNNFRQRKFWTCGQHWQTAIMTHRLSVLVTLSHQRMELLIMFINITMRVQLFQWHWLSNYT